MPYAEHQPEERLRRSIECFWTSRAPAGAARPQRVIPDGCMDVIFDLGAGRAAVVGTMTRALVVPAAREATDFLGVRFRPGWAPGLLGLAASEARDGELDLEDIWGAEGRALGEKLASLGSTRARIELLARELARRIERAPAPPPVARALDEVLEAGGVVRVEPLAASTGLGARQLERAFAQLVGVSPRTFARIVRFRAAADEVRRSLATPRWAELAARLGFYDQAHLIREFRALAGLTPGAFAREAAMSRSSNTAGTPAPIFAAEDDHEEDGEAPRTDH